MSMSHYNPLITVGRKRYDFSSFSQWSTCFKVKFNAIPVNQQYDRRNWKFSRAKVYFSPKLHLAFPGGNDTTITENHAVVYSFRSFIYHIIILDSYHS